ncbi:MAG: ATP-binding protein [Alphaproteobacteria bacterium]|nr:ATP-binding protein [Alphaproteobacteria bacterium]
MQSSYYLFFIAETALILILLPLIALLVINLRRNDLLKDAIEDIIESSVGGYIVFDKNGHFLKTNRKTADYFPFLIEGQDSKAKGKTYSVHDFFSYLHDHSVDFDKSVRNAVSGLDQNGAEFGFCEVVKGDNGSLCYVFAKNIGKEFTVFIVKDISQGHQREALMLDMGEHNKQLLQAVQASTSGILVTDPKQGSNPVVFYNKSMKNVLGDSYDEIEEQGWQSIFDIMQDKEEKRILWNVISNAIDKEVEIRIKRPNEELQWFSAKVSSIKNEKGEIDLIIGTFSETTLLKQREAEISHGQKMDALGRLAAGIAHDFNNVLSIIDGFRKMASMDVDINSKTYTYLDRIHAASKRGAALTRKMLTFSRHKIVSNEVIDMSALVREQAELLNPLLGGGVSLDISISEDEVPVLCSDDSIEQVMMNLVLNARDAMPEGGQIFVRLDVVMPENVPLSIKEKIPAEEYACLKVIDTGMGMEKEVLEKIFDPFFTTKGAGKGTGLGMSVVYGLVNEIGGAINITSTPKKGTCMEVYIPVSENKVIKKIIGDEGDLSSISLEGYTALIAEDEPDLRLLVSNILQDLGLNILEAENGDEALIVQEDFEGNIDILLTDVVMPGMNGVKLAELFHSMRPKTKTIFMSGYPANGDMAPVNLPENACFIAKPVNYDHLAKLLLRQLHEEGNGNDGDGAEDVMRWETVKNKKGDKTNAA